MNKTHSLPLPRPAGPLCRRLFVSCLALVAAAAGAVENEPSEAGAVYFETIPHSGLSYAKAFFTPQETPAVGVRVWAAAPASGRLELSARVWDYWGRPAGTVAISPAAAPAGGHADFLLRPSVTGLGWFRLELALKRDGTEVTLKRKMEVPRSAETYDFLAFARLPEPRTAMLPDSPFGLMTALLEQPYCSIEAQIDLAANSGAKWVRDIISWAAANPGPDRFEWVAKRENFHRLAAKGLSILGLIQTSPDWTHPEVQAANALPADLLAAHRFAREVAQAFGSDVKAWEIWNEPDIKHFNLDPTDRYATVLKAMSLGLRAGALGTTVVPGGLARDPRAGGFSTLLAANEVAPYLDVYNFHSYAPLAGGRFQHIIEVHRETATQLGMGDRPQWLTETSLPYARNEVPADPLAAMRASVTHLHASYMEAIARGVRPLFWFIGRPYISQFSAKPSQWGMVDTQLSPVPAYPAYAVLAHQLGEGKFLGSLPGDTGTAYLFADGSETVAVVVPRDGHDRVNLPPAAGDTRAFDVMGNPLPLERHADGVRIASQGHAVYVRNPGWQAAVPAGTPVQKRAAPTEPRLNRAIVLHAVYPRRNIESTDLVLENWDDFVPNWAPRGYVYDAGEEIPFVLEVYNFGKTASAGTVTVTAPEGFQVSERELALEIPPGTKKSVNLRLTAPASAAKSPVMIVFSGIFSGRPVAPNAGRWKPTIQE